MFPPWVLQALLRIMQGIILGWTFGVTGSPLRRGPESPESATAIETLSMVQFNME